MRRNTHSLMFAMSLLILMTIGPAASSSRESGETDRRVEQLLATFSLEQKIDLIGGVDDFFIRGFEELGWPRLRMADGPMGVRNFGLSTAYAAGIGLAATWDPELARRVGEAFGRDARAKGVHFLLGPGVNIYRAPMNGRNFEYYGEDPWLASRVAVAFIRGVQGQGVVATIKHYMGNNSEFDRHNNNAQIDERTMREIYLPVFEAAVKEGKVGAIMDSYNLVNGTHSSQNGHLNNEIAKGEWGFRGIIMSDWRGTYDGVAAANNGLDLEMPSGRFMNREMLLPAITAGKVSMATLDDKVRRIIRTAAEFGFLDREQQDLSVPRFNLKHHEIAREAAEKGIVLLKNDSGLLPLNKDRITLAVLGPAAHPAVPGGGGSSMVKPFIAVSGLEGIGRLLGNDARLLYDRGVVPLDEIIDRTSFFLSTQSDARAGVRAEYFDNADCSGTPVRAQDEIGLYYESSESSKLGLLPSGPGKDTSVRYSGYYRARKTGPHHWFIFATGNDAYKLFIDEKLVAEHGRSEGQGPIHAVLPLEADRAYKVKFELGVSPSWENKAGIGVIASEDLVTPEAKKLAGAADVVVVMAGFAPETDPTYFHPRIESEDFDRSFGLPGGQEELIREVSAANPKTVVVLTAGGAVDAEPWIDRVPALLHAWYGGEAGGTALARVLFGEVSPSGHLPISWERRWQDNPVHDSYYVNNGGKNTRYSEGVFIGYRGYDKSGIKPLFPFGHGLSYTEFAYRDLKISPATAERGQEVTVSFEVTNFGQRAGAGVPQLYVGDPESSVPRPVKELKGFQRVYLEPGETQRVTLKLDARSMSFYDVKGRGWRQEPGVFTVMVGRSSADIVLKGECRVTR